MTNSTQQFTTIQSLADLAHEFVDQRGRRSVLSLIGFSLMSKITGRIIGCSMRLANQQLRESRIQTIDGANEILAAMAEREQSAKHSEDNGLEAYTSDPALLAHWVSLRNELIELGVDSRPYVESFVNLIERDTAKNTPNLAEAEQAAKMAGLSVKQTLEAFANQAKRKGTDTLATVDTAQGIILDVTTLEIFDNTDLDDQVAVMIEESFESANKSLLKTSDSVQEALASMMLLRATQGFEMEEMVLPPHDAKAAPKTDITYLAPPVETPEAVVIEQVPQKTSWFGRVFGAQTA